MSSVARSWLSNAVARRQRDPLGDPRADVRDHAGQVAPLGVAADDDAPPHVLAVDRVRPDPLADVGQLVEVHLPAPRAEVDPQLAQPAIVAAVRLVEAHQQVEAALAL
jgi:hypothetical protein